MASIQSLHLQIVVSFRANAHYSAVAVLGPESYLNES
jgi:hypothetical protein